jgi:hypothetical protein
MAVGPLQPGAKPTLAVIVEQDTNRLLVTRRRTENAHTQKLSDDFKAMPLLHDHARRQPGWAGRFGRADSLRKNQSPDPEPDKPTFEEEDVLPPGGSTEEPWMSVSDVDGDGKPELLLAQKNFVRAVVLKPEADRGTNGKPVWNFFVKEQINGASQRLAHRRGGAVAQRDQRHRLHFSA